MSVRSEQRSNISSFFWEPPWWTSFPVNNKRAEQPGWIWRHKLLDGPLFRCGGLVTSGIPFEAINKVEDDSDGHEPRHFKQGCETWTAASLSEDAAQQQKANGGLQVGDINQAAGDLYWMTVIPNGERVAAAYSFTTKIPHFWPWPKLSTHATFCPP